MAVSTNSTNLQQMQIARSKIYAGLISLGAPLLIFAAFGLLRAAAFSPQPAASAAASPTIEIPPGIYERSQPRQSKTDEFVEATDGHDANLDLDAFWKKRQDGLAPANPVPGCAPCAETGSTGFRTGSGDEAHTNISQHIGQWAVDGYSTGSGLRRGK